METEKSGKIKKILIILLAVSLLVTVIVTTVSAEDAGVKEPDVPVISHSNPSTTPVNSDITCDLKDNGIPPD